MEDLDWHIGKVKFFDHDKGFGFLTDLKRKKDYFAHVSQIRNGPIQLDNNVVFQIKFSRKKPGNFEAWNIIHLSQFPIGGDNNLIYTFFNGSALVAERYILEQLSSDLQILIAKELIGPFFLIDDDKQFNEFKDKSNLLKKLFTGIIENDKINQIIATSAEELSSDNIKVQMWLNGLIITEPDIELISKIFINTDSRTKIEIYNKLKPESKRRFYPQFIDNNNLFKSINHLFIFLNIEKDYTLQAAFINITFSNSLSSIKLKSQEAIELHKLIITLLSKLDIQTRKLLISQYYNVCPDYFKLLFWINNYVDRNDYNIYFANFILLKPEDQIRFIKKCFYLLHQNINEITLEKILRLKNLTFTYQESHLFQTDFSTNVLLSTIEEINKGKFLTEEAIFEIISHQVEQNPKMLLSLTGFFEHCHGRHIPDQVDEEDIDNKRIISLKKISIPRNIEFCEGVKFGGDGKDKTYKHDCWWCRGGSCYEPNQGINIPENYINYTLASLLKILNIDYDSKSHFNYLGLLNKINVFLKHLNCRDCGQILKPHTSKEKYNSYYRVSNFKCNNSQCTNNDIVYLNHCLGSKKTAIKSKCDSLIDSRDTRRCNYSKHNPTSEAERYGPYICNMCGSCCSQISLDRKFDELIERKSNIFPGLKWKVQNKVGHLERNEVFCFKCGNEMVNNENQYREFVNGIERNGSSHKILKKGVNHKGFWYLIKAEETFFEKAVQVGLRVSQSNSNDQSIRFISEGNRDFLTCLNCNVLFNIKKAEFLIEHN